MSIATSPSAPNASTPAARGEDRGAPRRILSPADRRRVGVRAWFTGGQAILLLATALAGAGPMFWMLKGALSSTQELLQQPLRPWPSAVQWSNLTGAWHDLEIGKYLVNTVVLVGGSWIAQLIVAATAGFALSVLRPWFGRYVYAAILATLFVPGTVSLVALYLTVLDLPLLGVSIVNTPLAIWLPAAAHAFNVLLAKQFFDSIPRDLFEAAEVDGAGPWTVFWRIVLPMSKPILAVLSILTIMASWKDFLWPLIALTDTTQQPLSVALPRVAAQSDLSLLIAGLLISTIPPLLIFAVFNRHITRGIGFTGLKG